MPARGSRLSEAAYRKIGDLVRILAEKISSSEDIPFAFFGHSLGATVAFELSLYLRKIGHRQPSHLFVSGRCAPQVDKKRPPTYQLSDDEFTEDIRRLGGTPPEILENIELMQLLLPALRADLQMVQTYEYQTEKPVSFPISAFGGLHDDFVKPENLAAWRAQTTDKFVCRMIEGDHFFLNFKAQKIAHFIIEDLSASGFRI